MNELDVWAVEKGKPAGECITPDCKRLKYNDASRCKHCLNKQKRTPRPPKEERAVLSDEGAIPRRISDKPPVLPYAFRHFGWKGTLSEELRRGQ